MTYRAENRNTVVARLPFRCRVLLQSVQKSKDTDKYAALDQADKLERQIVKYRKKLQARAKQDKTLNPSYFTATPDDAEERPWWYAESEEYRQNRWICEACLQMELLGHDFFVFRNIANQQIMWSIRKKKPAPMD